MPGVKHALGKRWPYLWRRDLEAEKYGIQYNIQFLRK